MTTVGLDLRYSFRTFRKDPGYVLVTVLLLALGIGANTAIFNVANAVLFRSLRYKDPEQLVVTLHNGDAPVSPADFLYYKQSAKSFEEMAAAQMWGGSLTEGDRPERIPGLRVTANMIHLLGVAPMLGRSFRPEEEHSGREHALLVSYGLWRRLGSDPNILGRRVSIDAVPFTVIGVMPASFQFAPFWATQAQMWSPLVLDERVNDRGGRSLRVFARLKRGVTVAQARSELDGIAKHLAQAYPATNAKLGISVIPLGEKVVRSVRPTLLVLLGAVAFLLLIACATAGNLILSRAINRRKEMALRLAIGARVSDLIRMTVTEILLLSLGAAVAGGLMASWAVSVLSASLPPGVIPRQTELGFDRMGLLFAGVITVLAALITSLIPALQASRADVNNDLKEGVRGGTSMGKGRGNARSLLLVTEVALSCILLAGAGLMVRTMVALQGVDAGFNPRNVLTFQVSVSGTPYNVNGRRANIFRELRNRIASAPGVQSVSAINHLPIGGDIWRLSYSIDGRPTPTAGNQTSAVYRVIMPGYFSTMRLGLLAGRDFNERDDVPSRPVAIINEAMAKRRWPAESALGKVIRYGTTQGDLQTPTMIIGVVRNARQNDWTSPADDEIYLAYLERPDSMGLSYLTFVLRTRTNPDRIKEAILGTVAAFDRGLTVSDVADMEQIIADELWRQRLATALIASFAALAVLLAAIGIYGVISNSVRRRTQEIGIRMALGANWSDLVKLTFEEGIRAVILGTLIGLTAAIVLTRYMQSLLFGVTPADPVTFAAIVAALIAVCGLANLVPALRASRIDPLLALRHN